MSRGSFGFTLPKRPTSRPAAVPPSRIPTRKKLPTFVDTTDDDTNLSSDPTLPESRSRISTRPLPKPGPKKTVRFQDDTEDLITEASENSSEIQVDDEIPFPRVDTVTRGTTRGDSPRRDLSSDLSDSSEDEPEPLKIQDKIYSSRDSEELPPVAPRFTRPSSPIRPDDRQRVINTIKDDSDSEEEIYRRPVEIDDDTELSRSQEDSEEQERQEQKMATRRETQRLADTIRDLPPSTPTPSKPAPKPKAPTKKAAPSKPAPKVPTSRVDPRDVPPSAPEKPRAQKSNVKTHVETTCHQNEVFVEKPEPVRVKCPQSDVVVERPDPVKVKLPTPDVIVEAADPVHIKCPQSDVIVEQADPVVIKSPRSRVTYVESKKPKCPAATTVITEAVAVTVSDDEEEEEIEVDVVAAVSTPKAKAAVAASAVVMAANVDDDDDLPDKKPRQVKICRSPVSSPTFPRALSPQRPLSPVVKSTSSLCGASIDHILRSFGYTPLTKIIIEHSDCRKGKYVKCLDPMGNTVYVKLDVEDGHIAVSSSDLMVTKGKVIEQIPHSARRMYRDDQFMCGIGIAIDCKYGICFIVRNRKGHIRECDYHFTYDSCGSKFITDCSLMALPVVSLYEIQCNCSWVINNTDVLMTRLVNMAHRNCLNDVKKYECSMMRLATATTKFRQIYRDSSRKLAESTECHRKYIRDVFACGGPRRDCEGMRKHQLLLYNLQRRHELLVELIHAARVVANLSCQLDSVSNDVEELNGYMCETFQGVDRPMMP